MRKRSTQKSAARQSRGEKRDGKSGSSVQFGAKRSFPPFDGAVSVNDEVDYFRPDDESFGIDDFRLDDESFGIDDFQVEEEEVEPDGAEEEDDGDEDDYDVRSEGGDSDDAGDDLSWLNVLNKGLLSGDKMRDPAFLTARQRALDFRGDEDPIPTGPDGRPLPADDLRRKAITQKKRRDFERIRRAKQRMETLDRLMGAPFSALMSRGDPSAVRVRTVKLDPEGAQGPRRMTKKITYCQTVSGSRLSVTPGVAPPLQYQRAREPPAVVKCGVPGCSQPKKYVCSKTKVPVCSLTCYQKNLRKTQTDSRRRRAR